MARGMPSMVALLGLLAVAGYQNREKLGELLGGGRGAPGPDGRPRTGGGGLDGILGNLGGMLGGAGAGGGLGGMLSGGIGDLVDQFKQRGKGDVADSWVQKGPNKQVAPDELEQALGGDVVDSLAQQTGLSRQEVLARLSKALPEAIDKYTPDGRVPTADEANRIF
jgi:uncharacterized protein YidB (DUF937 family)